MAEKPPRAKQQRAVATRARLVEAARRQFFANGYAATTSNHIAEAAGVSIGTFYNHFPDKKQVLAEIIQQSMADSLAIGDPLNAPEGLSPQERRVRLDLSVRQLLVSAPDFVALQSVWQDAAAVDAEFREALRRFEEESFLQNRAIVKSLAPHANADELDLAAYAVRGMLNHVVRAWAQGSLGNDLEKTHREIVRLLHHLQALYER